jgi:hypothetical protein
MNPYTGSAAMPNLRPNVLGASPSPGVGQAKNPVRRPDRSGPPPRGPVRRRKGGQRGTAGMRLGGGPKGQMPQISPAANPPKWPMAPEGGQDNEFDWSIGRRLGNGGYSR